ncbi:uncharacterized protein MYCFIDRAFT_59107 [Pseudocercospora fijiensis CIRAD86]|uniref:Carboxylic ester hydrolase n=1 Tax=Pseudocercospora fijiensis (strain CIRAD86) TaxID=383855 RepID=M3B1S8_PSEFD|nr:uncharacterized protein MYCFIDRAFT_59107 [Pseudocercospora fijiensis CIRAD86]EME83367.1 hypothetical protein MYCFIDRAFT_59107 [Pseudocercospora fijiensis CIRAD86]
MMSIHASLAVFALILIASGSPTRLEDEVAAAAPTAVVKNGSYVGTYNPSYGTDHFLGMPFAQAPVGDLRFKVPQPLSESWLEERNATEYGYECVGYGRDTWSQGNYVSEDCLTLNVVRARSSVGPQKDLLPVLVWIHGGGHYMGGSADRRYNQSFIVQQAEEAGQPIVAVSINYRLASWGFLYGRAIQESGNTMLGYRDQRLALHWVQENIAAFGGDPSRVTIQGESAGASSVGVHLLAYTGRDDDLFHQAILQSGTGTLAGSNVIPTAESWEPVISNISSAVNCSDATDLLACLRAVPYEELNAVLNSTATSGASYGLVIDNDLITTPGIWQISHNEFVHVPILVGCNTDEGSGSSINTTSDFLSYVNSRGYDNVTAQDFSILYPDIPELGIPETFDGRPAVGAQYKRAAALSGDLGQHGPRRLASQLLAQGGIDVYSYRFNVLVNGFLSIQGAAHFQEVAFTFYNTEGLGYPQNGNPNPLGGENREQYLALAKQMTRMWISFVNFGDPNRHGLVGDEFEYWPKYAGDGVDEVGKNFVFEQNVTSHAEDDLYRAEGIEYIGRLIEARNGKNCSGLVDCGGSATYP